MHLQNQRPLFEDILAAAVGVRSGGAMEKEATDREGGKTGGKEEE